MIFLQIVKTLLNKQQTNTVFNSSGVFQETHHQATSSYIDGFIACFKKYFVSFISTFTYDVKQMEATKTEIINFVKLNEPAISLAKNQDSNLNPAIISESYINFSELFQFSNIKHIIKLTYLFNLNLNCILINLALLSYFLVKLKKNRSQKVGDFFGKNFFKLNLLLVNFLFVVLISIDSLYMLFLNSSFRSLPNTMEKSNLKETNILIDYLLNYVKILDKKQPDYFTDEFSKQDVIAVESSYSSLHSTNNIPSFSNTNEFFTMITLKINIGIMVISICMLSLYSYITKLDMESGSFLTACNYCFIQIFSFLF